MHPRKKGSIIMEAGPGTKTNTLKGASGTDPQGSAGFSFGLQHLKEPHGPREIEPH
ncbi:hypothetical protein GCM10008938_37050 [Deinococcus roseus]|uniref:Uncharacterized protein n=1 Tax=Deinococcus roseus TaxID=392414 RepID=A0ABQ2D8R9_9DEIO|nr:hypothetical protein GCM10008938_37050 [Deinococcus roseus]